MREQTAVTKETDHSGRRQLFFQTMLFLSMLDLVFLLWIVGPRGTKQILADSNSMSWRNNTSKPTPLGKNVVSHSGRPVKPQSDM